MLLSRLVVCCTLHSSTQRRSECAIPESDATSISASGLTLLHQHASSRWMVVFQVHSALQSYKSRSGHQHLVHPQSFGRCISQSQCHSVKIRPLVQVLYAYGQESGTSGRCSVVHEGPRVDHTPVRFRCEVCEANDGCCLYFLIAVVSSNCLYGPFIFDSASWSLVTETSPLCSSQAKLGAPGGCCLSPHEQLSALHGRLIHEIDK